MTNALYISAHMIQGFSCNMDSLHAGMFFLRFLLLSLTVRIWFPVNLWKVSMCFHRDTGQKVSSLHAFLSWVCKSLKSNLILP